MKKIFTLILSSGLFFQSQAQTANAVVYSELGEKFTLYLNSEPQNEKPQSNVKIKDLTADYYQARIDFEDPTLADFANSNFAVQKGLEVTYIVKKNKKGEYVLRYHGESPIGGAVVTVPAEHVIESDVTQIAEVDNIETTGDVVSMQMDVAVEAPAEEVVEVVTTTTTTSGNGKPVTKPTGTKTTENVSMGVNVGGVNMGVNFKVDETNVDMNMDVEESSSTTKTTTTTTKTTTTSKPATTTKPAPKPAAKPDVVIVESTAGCSKAMSSTDFAGAKTSISGKGFEEQKLSTAKMITKANCLTAAQIKEICGLFGFEETKLTFAKHAYDFCTDKGNYYVVNDAFSFSSSTEELEQFISTK